MVGITWDDAVAYCRWISDKTGRRYRLPSEAEWEKAASWGTEADKETDRQVDKEQKQRYPWGDAFDATKCNTLESGIGTTTAVGAYSAKGGDSPCGAADMAGNVREWTSTRWGAERSQPQYAPPYDPGDGRENLTKDEPFREYRIVRGGSYQDGADRATCTARGRDAADKGSSTRVSRCHGYLRWVNFDIRFAIRNRGFSRSTSGQGLESVVIWWKEAIMTLNLQRATRSTPKPPAMTAFWPDTKDRVAQGRITPFISNYMSAALFGIPRGQLAVQWAKDIGSPFAEADNRDIAHVAQYYAVTHENNRLEAKQNYLNMLTDYLLGKASQDESVDQELVQDLLAGFEQCGSCGKPFSEIARDLGYPRFDAVEANPFRLLAEMPLPIYITTSHHQFLEYALAQTQNKEPVSEIFYWGDHFESIPSIFDETPRLGAIR